MGYERCGRKSTGGRFRRWLAMVVSLAVLAGLLPVTVFAENSNNTDRFSSLLDPGKPEKYSDDMANPYGYEKGQKFLLSEENELLLYYTYDTKTNTRNQYTSWFDQYVTGEKPSLTSGRGGFNHSGTYSDTQAFGYVQAVGFDPNGTGRKDHVAYIGYENGGQTIDGVQSYKGYVLWVMDTVSGSQYGPWRISLSSCDWLKNADLYAGSNFFNIAAGDFDADGKEDLIISVVDDNQNYGLSQIRFANGSITKVMEGNRELFHPAYQAAAGQGNEARDKLSMDFAVGDFNGDGVDDFAVLSYPNYGSRYNSRSKGNKAQSDVHFGQPYLSVSYGSTGGANIVTGEKASSYIDADFRDIPGKGGRSHVTMFCASVAAGDIDGDGRDELLTAGYEGNAEVNNGSLGFGPVSDSHLLYGSFYASGSSLTLIEYRDLEMNGWTQHANGCDDPVGPKLVIESVAIDGKANPERIFISGDMYRCERGGNQLSVQSGGESPITLDYFKNADKSVQGRIVGKSYIAAVAVGGLEARVGYEQIAYVVGLQSSDTSHLYSFSVHMAGGNGYIDDCADGYYNLTGDYIFYNQGFDLTKRPNCVIAAIDRDQDGMVASYKGSGYAWSDPQVRAVLQASPYFAELNDGDSGAEYLYDSPETEYATSELYSFESSSSNSVSVGAGFAGELDGGVVSGSLQVGYAFDWTESFTKSLETEVKNSFKAGAYDTVVLCRTPVFLYNYDVSYLDEAGDVITDVFEIAVPRAPVYEQLSVERYQEFVTCYNSLLEEKSAGEDAMLQKLGDHLFLGQEGNPYGYYRDDASGAPEALQKYGDLKKLTTNTGSNSVEYSYSESDGQSVEKAHGFTFDLCIMAGFGVGGASAKAGGYVSLQYMKGHSVSTSNGTGTSFGGTVMGLDGKKMEEDGLDPDAWSFNWRLAVWDSGLRDTSKNSKGYVPVIGYALNSVQAPPLPVENLKVQHTRSTEGGELDFDLSWDLGDVADSGRPQTAGYCIYLYDIAEDSYRLVGSIDDPQTTTWRYENFFDGREYYRFLVTAFCEASHTSASLESAPRYATYYMSTADAAILKIEKSSTEGLEDTYTIYFADGTTQTFTVTNGNGIVSVELLSSDPETRTDTYQITFADGSTQTFTVTNGEQGEQGEQGEPGVGVDRIEKLATEGNMDVYAIYLTDGTFYTFTVTNGRDGAAGRDGTDGRDGADGRDGTDGRDGANGGNGADGQDGATGREGASGQGGTAGWGRIESQSKTTGNGSSAGSGSSNGSGTGETGNGGTAGKDGADGRDGTDGVGITDIRIDENGDFIFTMSDGSKINAGKLPANQEQEKQQAQGSACDNRIAWCALILACVSLLWQTGSLIHDVRRGKKKAKRKRNDN